MVKNNEKVLQNSDKNVKADVIILGCSLPGIVIAHKLKKKFGDTMDIVVIDLAIPMKTSSKYNVTFQIVENESDFDTGTAQELLENIARHYLVKYARDLCIPLPDAILSPELISSPFSKLFQYSNGTTVQCNTNYHDFSYLNMMERLELNQYQTLLDESMRALFHCERGATEEERRKLLYYDSTNMEAHICSSLLLSNSRDVMRLVVKLVCGATANSVSVLFYLHQCYRTNGCKNHLDGANTRFREKLLGYFRRRMTNQIQSSLADIILCEQIKTIRNYPNEKVVLETKKGGTNYVCNLLAMALRPDQLHDIHLDEELVSKEQSELIHRMRSGLAKKFVINYRDHFWRRGGYSGDILSMRGPIIWATEKPKLSTTGTEEKYAAIIGFLKNVDGEESSKNAVITQLVKLFGEEAAYPMDYTESNVTDIYIPHCGDYVAMQTVLTEHGAVRLEWGALDLFAEGDVAAALEAGHTAYLHVLRSLRPQALTYDDVCAAEWPTMLDHEPMRLWLSHINYVKSLRFVAYSVTVYVVVKFLKRFWNKGN